MKISENFVFRLMKVNCVADAQYLYSRHSRPVIILLNSAWKSSSKSFFNQKYASESDRKILNNLPPIFAPGAASRRSKDFWIKQHFSHNDFLYSHTDFCFLPQWFLVLSSNDFPFSLTMISLFQHSNPHTLPARLPQPIW